MPGKLKQQITLADMLLKQLERYGDEGCELVGSFAHDFMRSLARKETIDDYIPNYLSEIQKLHEKLPTENRLEYRKSQHLIMRLNNYIEALKSGSNITINSAIVKIKMIDQ